MKTLRKLALVALIATSGLQAETVYFSAKGKPTMQPRRAWRWPELPTS